MTFSIRDIWKMLAPILLLMMQSCLAQDMSDLKVHATWDLGVGEGTFNGEQPLSTHVWDEVQGDMEDGDSQQDVMPERLSLHFDMLDEYKTLNLTRNPNINASVPILIGRNGEITTYEAPVKDNFALYYDEMNQASILVTTQETQSGGTQRYFSGSFRHGEKDYLLSPALAEDFRRKRRSTEEVLNSTQPIYNIYDNENVDYDNIEPDPGYPVRDSLLAAERMQEESELYIARDSSPKQWYGIELMLLLDHGIFDRWWNMATEPDPVRREEEVINNLRFYFSHVINGVDMRYKSIEDTRVAFYVRLNAFYIATTARDSMFTDTHKEYDDGEERAFVHAYRVLNDYEAWLEAHEEKLPHHDQATLFTGYTLFGGIRDDGSRRVIQGLAEIKGMCTGQRSAGLSRHKGAYSDTQTVSHELGHNLGSIHDGSGNECTGTDQFIMASSPGNLDENNYQNTYTFSACSIRAMRDFMVFLDLQGRNCLLDEAFHNPVVDMSVLTPLGQLFTLDQQCMIIHGTRSFYCAGQMNDRDICRIMPCMHPNLGLCYSTVDQRAANGTTCGNNKWCVFGECRESSRAPTALDYCRSGDYRGQFPDGRRCVDIEFHSPWECYNTYYRDACCATCAMMNDTRRPDCPFGDHHGSCSAFSRRDCYNVNVFDECCDTCFSMKSTQEGCVFGNRASWCVDIKPHDCYTSEYTCCETCAPWKTGPEGCEYGDHWSWCVDLSSQQCYNEYDSCCVSCQKYYTEIQGCEYGDRSRYCENVDCSDAYYQERCCMTCKDGHLQTLPAAPDAATRNVTTTTSTTRPTTTTTTSTTTTSTTTTTTRFTTPTTTTTSTTTSLSTTTPDPSCKKTDIDAASWCNRIGPYNCYTDAYWCCETCPLHFTGIPDCEYGDKFSWCATTYPGNCYTKNVRDNCCETCPSNYIGLPGCEYGDNYVWCETITLNECQREDIRRPCCLRCRDYIASLTTSTQRPAISSQPTTTTSTTTSTTTTTPQQQDCPGGDKASWCPEERFRAICYNSRETCCDTCASRYTGVRGCEYGDHVSWCPTIDLYQCKDTPSYMDLCCQTCAPFIVPTRAEEPRFETNLPVKENQGAGDGDSSHNNWL